MKDFLNPEDDNEKQIQFHIAQNLKGLVSVNDLLQSTNGFLLTGYLDNLTSVEGVFIYIREGKKENPNYVLTFGYKNNIFYISRNGYRVDYPIDDLDKRDNEISLFMGIEPNTMFMYILDKAFKEKIKAGGDLLWEISNRKKYLPLQFFLRRT